MKQATRARSLKPTISVTNASNAIDRLTAVLLP